MIWACFSDKSDPQKISSTFVYDLSDFGPHTLVVEWGKMTFWVFP